MNAKSQPIRVAPAAECGPATRDDAATVARRVLDLEAEGIIATARALEKLASAQRAEGNVAEAAKLEAQAKAIRQSTVDARTGLESNAKAMREALKGDGGPGWETQFRKLVAERQSLVDNAVAHDTSGNAPIEGMGMWRKIGPMRQPGCSHIWPLLACTSASYPGRSARRWPGGYAGHEQ